MCLSTSYFEGAACGVLTLIAYHIDDLNKQKMILLEEVPYYGDLNALEMAVRGNCLKFISQSTVQNHLTSVWNGNTYNCLRKKNLFGKIASQNGFKANFKVRYFKVNQNNTLKY